MAIRRPKQRPRAVRDLTHAYQTAQGRYVLVVENRFSSKTPGELDVYIGEPNRLERFPARRCDPMRDGTKAFHIPNDAHPAYLFFPPLTAKKQAQISFHRESGGPQIETMYHANIDSIIHKWGDFDALDIDMISPQPRVG